MKSAQVFEYINHAEDYGIKVGKANADFSAIIKRSRDVAGGMSKGIEFLMKKNKIEVLKGFGQVAPGKKVKVTDEKGKMTEYTAKNIIIATGARSRQLPNLPQDGKKIIGYRDAMVLKETPKKMIVVGSGAIGVEFAYFYNAMGTEVTVVEYMPNIVPIEDIDISKQLERSFKKTGIKVNYIKANADELLERLKNEGENSPAYLFVSVDAGKLQKGADLGLFQKVSSSASSNTASFIETIALQL